MDNNIQLSIRSKAEELGFVKTGFARAEILEKESDELRQWLELGYDADMKWIEKGFDKRKDIRLVMEDAKSVISLAYYYNTPYEHSENLPKISRYAWGKDYHKIIKKKLKVLSRFIESLIITPKPQNTEKQHLSLIKTKFYVDDGPIMDKAWAVKAGIGWQGKHTNIINPEYGSWLFLSDIITNIEFDIYDEPVEDMCGNCNICINACPTGALIDDYKINSNLCISYQTIENKEDDIPGYIDLSGWIYGCDICQDVCPFNHKDIVTDDADFYMKEELKGKTKEELSALTEEEFNAIFADSPVKRTKYKGWKRNLKKLE
ncbi:MAG: tRNA epoxyqueuosine(34) reductase QueG [Ignavibacteriae bacterium]|nr:MAG: tRNA epoxyqueuosine(34) reductase QueG [Ignavibacteriota bacterium]